MLPLKSELTCRASGAQLRYLMQLYAPINEDPRAFHRAIYVFISPRGSCIAEPGAVRAFRCQLPRVNPYYPYDPPEPDDRPTPLTPEATALATRRCPSYCEDGVHGSDAADSPYPEYELEVEPEPETEEGAAAPNADVSRLMEQYKEKVQAEAANNVAHDDDVSAFGKTNAEVGHFASFTARISRAPEQCLRYTHASNAQPLWPSRACQLPNARVPPCARCGAPRRFEFQLLPQMLSFMEVDSASNEAPDWATVAVYTCSASCAPTPPLPSHGALDDPPSAESPEALAAVGLKATFMGLNARADLNGTECTVLGWQAEAGRWAVECSGHGGERLRAKSASLRPVLPEWSGGEGAEDRFARDGGYAEEYVWVQPQGE